MQARFSILEDLAAQVGLYMNRDKMVLILAKVKSKQTLGIARTPHNRKVDPFLIKYNDNEAVKNVESEYYLGSRITRTVT